MPKFMKYSACLVPFNFCLIGKIDVTEGFKNSMSTASGRKTIEFVDNPTVIETCRDSATYHNPLNHLLTCEHHKNTPCENWSALGLNRFEIEELLNKCPVSCNVPCWSQLSPSIAPSQEQSVSPSQPTMSLEIELSFIINQMPSLIESEGIEEFQEVSLLYLSSYIIGIQRGGEIFIMSFILQSQDIINNRRMLRYQRKIFSNSALKVVVKITVVSHNMKKDDIVEKMRMAVSSQGYSDVVKSSLGMNVGIILPSSKPDPNETKVTAANTYSVPTKVIVSITSTLLTISVVIFSVMIYQRRRKQVRQLFCLSTNVENFAKQLMMPDKEQETVLKSTLAISSEHKNNLMVDEGDFYRSIKSSPRDKVIETKIYQGSNIIPPIIVIDDIEDQVTDTSSNGICYNVKEVDRNEIIDSNLLEDTSLVVSSVTDPYGIIKPIKANFSIKNNNPYQRPEIEEKSPISLISSRPSIGETASALSTPESQVNNLEKLYFKDGDLASKKQNCLFDFNPDFDMEPEDDFTVLFEKKMKDGGKKSFTFKNSLKDFFKRTKVLGDECFSSSQISHDELSDISSTVRLDRVSSPSAQHGVDKKYHEYVIDDTSPCDKSNFDNVDHTFHDDTSPPDYDSANNPSVPKTFYYTFEVPVSGKLGIVIKSNIQDNEITTNQSPRANQLKQHNHFGPTIHKIKGYSPLLGMVQCGDIIISIDGFKTKNMDTGEITSLLSKLQSEKAQQGGKIKITIVSKDSKDGFEADSSACNYEYGDELGMAELPFQQKNDASNSLQSSNHSNRSFHLIGTGMSDDDDNSLYMMQGAENFF